VVEKRNMINYIQGGELALRVLGGVCFRGSFEFELFFVFSFGWPLFLPFVGFAVCSSSR
jgi:hypothetical protein